MSVADFFKCSSGRRLFSTSPSRLATGAHVRSEFTSFFKSKGHLHVPSSRFTNSGMVQFKQAFEGVLKPPAATCVSHQKCVRAGGKHNDLDNVGHTARHHTFFEMLGNFSFGDYYRDDAILWAWHFVTKVLGLSPDRLRVTVHARDDLSAEVWRKVSSLPSSRILRLDSDDNLWSMGDGAGPIGYCTEIFWDTQRPDHGLDEQWLEIWNIVLMSMQRAADGSTTPLPKPCVDTGMGLERVCSVLQGTPTNYETDLLLPLIDKVRSLHPNSRVAAADVCAAERNIAHKVIADHARAAVALVCDGVLPSNTGRGYVLRRILRRGVRYGHMLGLREPFMHLLAPDVAHILGGAYPEIVSRATVSAAVIAAEEEAFQRTLAQGLKLVADMTGSNGTSVAKQGGTISGADAFKLYDSLGFPADLTCLVAKQAGWDVDMKGFDAAMQQQRERARLHWSGSGDSQLPADVRAWNGRFHVEPSWHTATRIDNAQILQVADVAGGAGAWLALSPCPFYPEGGGQAADTGHVTFIHDGQRVRAAVRDCKKVSDSCVVISVANPLPSLLLSDCLPHGSVVCAEVDGSKRSVTAAHHSATHLLHSAIMNVLGTSAAQAGSSVDDKSLRFDFTYPNQVAPAQLAELERWVNDAAKQSLPVMCSVQPLADAIAAGAVAMFSEKYGSSVRTVKMGDVSHELCAGTHVSSTGDIYPFKIISESSISAGTRRIEAVAGCAAVQWYEQRTSSVSKLARVLSCAPEAVIGRVEKLIENGREVEARLSQLEIIAAVARLDQRPKHKWSNGSKSLMILLAHTDDAELLGNKALKAAVEVICSRENASTVLLLPSGVVMVAAVGSSSANDILESVLHCEATPSGNKRSGCPPFAQGKIKDAAWIKMLQQRPDELAIKLNFISK